MENKQYIWDVYKLWKIAKHLPILDIDLEILNAEVLEQNVWFQENHEPTVKNMITHYEKIQKANLDYPIILSPTNTVMDGVHRVAKAHMLGLEKIKAVRFEKLPEPNEIKILSSNTSKNNLSKFSIFSNKTLSVNSKCYLLIISLLILLIISQSLSISSCKCAPSPSKNYP